MGLFHIHKVVRTLSLDLFPKGLCTSQCSGWRRRIEHPRPRRSVGCGNPYKYSFRHKARCSRDKDSARLDSRTCSCSVLLFPLFAPFDQPHVLTADSKDTKGCKTHENLSSLSSILWLSHRGECITPYTKVQSAPKNGTKSLLREQPDNDNMKVACTPHRAYQSLSSPTRKEKKKCCTQTPVLSDLSNPWPAFFRPLHLW